MTKLDPEQLDPEQQAILEALETMVYPWLQSLDLPDPPEGVDRSQFRANVLVSMASSMAASLILQAAQQFSNPKEIRALLFSGAASLNGAFELAKDEILKDIGDKGAAPPRVH